MTTPLRTDVDTLYPDSPTDAAWTDELRAQAIKEHQQAHDQLHAQSKQRAGYQLWNGTAWTTRPTGILFCEAFSDGTASSFKDTAAPAPTGAVDGDRWWKALA